MLEYIKDHMESCKSVEECIIVLDRAIELCVALNIEQLRTESEIIKRYLLSGLIISSHF